MLLVTAAFAAPLATFAWKGGQGVLTVSPPAGHHVQAAAGAHLELSGETTAALDLAGAGAHAGVLKLGPLAMPAGDVTVTARFSVCDDAGTTCTAYDLGGTASGARGRTELGMAQRLATSTATGGVVKLYDFGAVWCPPCNLMLAEVLDDPADAALFAGRPVERIDVDRPESWALKSRYGVTGYPTLIAVDAAGNEVARQIGYPGEAAMKDWLAALGTEPPLHALVAGMSLPPEGRARAARRLAEADQDAAARAWLDGAADGEDLRVARLLLDDDHDAAVWLFDHGTPMGDWIWSAATAAPERWEALLPYAAKAEPGEEAGLLAMAAESAPEALRPGLRRVALASVQAALTGVPLHDKALWGDVADLQAQTGDLPAAVRTLDAAITAFPDEFTFYYAAARILLDGKDLPAAEKRAREALAHAFGDQVLRAAVRLSDVLVAAGRKAEAKVVLDDALVRIPAPPDGVKVRTSRYRAEAEARKAAIAP